ncbi:MAG: hypothetical protein J5601_06075 [Elusimicrobiaceae bacterium]|nr:hypothetical protein [Elusimicrobiaceae bacterium]
MRYYFPFILAIFLLGACTKTVHVHDTQVQATPVKNRVKQVKQSLHDKKTTRKEIPSILGGVVKSDRWVIYKDKEQEEFSGNVFYDNGTYSFKADYALSERALHRITAKGNVYLKQKEKDTSYEAYADWARFNYKTQQGTINTTHKGHSLKLVYTDENNIPVIATAQKATFDLNTQVFTLEGNVRIERTSQQGVQSMTADKVTVRKLEDFVLLEGNAVLSDGEHTLEAQTILYDGAHNTSSAYGDRPLLHGTTPQGTFAIIADRVSSDAEGNQINIEGNLQGWFVSPEVNKIDFSKFNQGIHYGTAQ